MPTVISRHNSLGVQCTSEAKRAGLATVDRPDGPNDSLDVTGEPVRVEAAAGIAIATHRHRVSPTEHHELVTTLITEGEPWSERRHGKLSQRGSGVALAFPESVAESLGVALDKRVSVQAAPDLLVVAADGTDARMDALTEIRAEQTE